VRGGARLRRPRQWEHRMVSGDETVLESIMAQMGQEGWELVAVVSRDQAGPTPRPEGFYLFFKRPVSN
jgi:hypothetical protein